MCTRVIYTPKNNQSYVGRNMDWSIMPEPDLWVFPQNVERNSYVFKKVDEEKEDKTPSFSWQSKFSSVVTSNFDGATSDGLNSEGLTANILWLTRSQFPETGSASVDGLLPMALSVWAQYILDNCATVADAVSAMNNIYILTTNVPGSEKLATCHLSVGDKEGNSAIFEYIDKKLVIYTNVSVEGSSHTIKQYSKDQMRVMTNDPEFNKQVESLVYWDELNVTYQRDDAPALLPGSNLAMNRFIRATYYTRQLPDENDRLTALAQVATVIANTAQPEVKPKDPEILGLSRTQYSSLADQYALQYFYRSANSPFMIWISLKNVSFDKLEKGMAWKIALEDQKGVLFLDGDYASGNVNGELKQAPELDFIPIYTEG